MRKLRFLFFLAAVFLACFWIGGGSSLLTESNGAIPAALQENLREKLDESPALAEQAETLTAAWQRGSRIVRLPEAVAEQVREKAPHYVPIQQINPSLQQAVVAVEDNRFYEHAGFDVTAMLRAALVNLQFGEIEEGGSTITQQLVKNLFLSSEQSFARKAEELLLAVDMEARYPKEKILELYLNTIYFGSGFYGVHDAARGYFGKNPDELTLSEAALLAGLPNAPSLYSPYVDPAAARRRQSVVLEAMRQAGYITAVQADEIKTADLRFAE